MTQANTKKSDLLKAIRAENDLHPQFKQLRDSLFFEPARGMLREVFADFHDPDGNFIEQFQTTGFDARTFELYLHAVFKEQGFSIDRSHQRPDFLLHKDGQTVCVESVTANPPPNGIIPYGAFPLNADIKNAEQRLLHEIPIRFGSPLFSKLNKKYWELPHVAGKPLVIAIQSFHEEGSLTISSSPLASYLFGLSHHWYHDADGKLIISAEPIETHKLGAKEIPSGFFAQPGAENISAILFSNCGTIGKFNRMGFEGAYHSPHMRMLRFGTRYHFNPDSSLPAPFLYEVGNEIGGPGDDGGEESWRESTVLFPNPNALHPIPEGFLGASAEERLVDDQCVTTFYEPMHPFMSMTMHFPGDIPTAKLQQQADQILAHLLSVFPLPTDLD